MKPSDQSLARLVIQLTLISVFLGGSQLLANPQEKSVAPITGDEIFMEVYTRWLTYGSAMEDILMGGRKPSEDRRRPHLVETVQQLPVQEKCRFALLWFVTFGVNGESSWTLTNAMGDDMMEVGKRLKQISDQDFLKACRFLEEREGRLEVFRTMVNNWAAGKK